MALQFCVASFPAEDFIARLAALVPRPRAHLVRNHGLFAPNARVRAHILPRTRSGSRPSSDEPQPRPRSTPMNWMARLHRLLAIDLATCPPARKAGPTCVRFELRSEESTGDSEATRVRLEGVTIASRRPESICNGAASSHHRNHFCHSAFLAKHCLAIDECYDDSGDYEQYRIVWRSVGKNRIVQLPVNQQR